jgi:hypothetical protein
MAKPMSPTFAEVLHKLTVMANKNGYGLLHHGSAIRDLDVVAIPMDKRAVKPDKIFLLAKDIMGEKYSGPHLMAHQRVAWLFTLDEFHDVDFSIMDTLDEMPVKTNN